MHVFGLHFTNLMPVMAQIEMVGMSLSEFRHFV